MRRGLGQHLVGVVPGRDVGEHHRADVRRRAGLGGLATGEVQARRVVRPSRNADSTSSRSTPGPARPAPRRPGVAGEDQGAAARRVSVTRMAYASTGWSTGAVVDGERADLLAGLPVREVEVLARAGPGVAAVAGGRHVVRPGEPLRRAGRPVQRPAGPRRGRGVARGDVEAQRSRQWSGCRWLRPTASTGCGSR